MRFTILTLFPDFFLSPFDQSIVKRAQDETRHQGHPPLNIQIINIRDFATDKHRTTDDHPYGGGAGMVMKIEPIDRALENLRSKNEDSNFSKDQQTANSFHDPNGTQHKSQNTRVILTSAKGKPFTQKMAQEYALLDELVIICGHYEGVDERVAEHLIDEEVRIGDYVMTGGEPAAIVIVDAVSRLLPNVLGNEASPINESHSKPGYLEHPQYTRPEEYKGWKVPEILLTGHHKKIEEWRQGKKD